MPCLPELQQGEKSKSPPNENSAKSIFRQSSRTVRFKFLTTPNSFHERNLIAKTRQGPGKSDYRYVWSAAVFSAGFRRGRSVSIAAIEIDSAVRSVYIGMIGAIRHVIFFGANYHEYLLIKLVNC